MTATLMSPYDSGLDDSSPDDSGPDELSLDDLRRAVRAGWSRETCDPDDLADWRPDNPARGQCGVTALLVHDLFGGDLVLGTVRVGGELRGFHWWNALPGEVEVDLTREQFGPHEIVGEAQRISRPAEDPRRCLEEYSLFRERVLAALGRRPRAVVRARRRRPYHRLRGYLDQAGASSSA